MTRNGDKDNSWLCPITSHLIETPLFRIELSPSEKNGLQKSSQVMIDKITAIKSEKIREKIGRITSSELQIIDQALKLWLSL